MKILILTFILTISANISYAELVTYGFRGDLTYSNGNPFGVDGTGGVVGQFIYDNHVLDSNSDSDTGEYFNALVGLSFEIDDTLFTLTKPGNVGIYNDIHPTKFDIFNLFGSNILNTSAQSEVLIQHSKEGGEWLQSDRIDEAGSFVLGGSSPSILQLKDVDTGEWYRFDFNQLEVVPEPASATFLFLAGALLYFKIRVIGSR